MNDLASVSAFFGIPAVALAMLFWAQFSLTKEDRYGVMNDIAVVFALIFLVLPVIAVNDLIGEGNTWLGIVTWAALAGLVLAAIGQLLLIGGAIRLGTSFVTGGMGIVPVLAWMVTLTVIALGEGHPPNSVGWSAIVLYALLVPVILTSRAKPPVAIAAQSIMTAGLAIWLFYLGLYLSSA